MKMEEEFEVSIKVELRTGRKFPLLVAFYPSATCSDILETVKDTILQLKLTAIDSQWTLIERWRHGLEKKLSSRSNFSSAINSWSNEKVSFIAREKKTRKNNQNKKPLPTTTKRDKIHLKKKELYDVKRDVTRLRLAAMLKSLSTHPHTGGLGSEGNPAHSSANRSDPIRLIATMSDKLDTLENNKAHLANEVFDMNHEATRLTAHLTVLRRTSQTISDSLTQFKETRDRKKAEREQDKLERLEYLNEAIASSQMELEKRHRMSELQDGKITLLQEEISTLQKSLSQREKEVDKMKEWVDHKAVNSFSTSALSIPVDIAIKKEREGGDSFKRRFMNTNIKTKQQIEEEARVFRKVSSGSSLPRQESTDGPNGEVGGAPIEPVQRRHSSRAEEKKEKKGILRSSMILSDQKLKKKLNCVNFDAKSLLLNAAGEGDLELIKKCIKELGEECKMVASAKGATCLHYAVCSSNLTAVQYFIDMGCDINAQDCEGWTPLHCAAGFTHLPAIHLLVQNGASLYLRTLDDQLSVDLVREMAEEGSLDDAAGNDIDAQNCYDYLRDCSKRLGTLNERRVYCLFNYIATSNDELSFITGEELVVLQRGSGGNEGWWEVENAHGIRGYVPSTFLGSYPRKQTVL